MRIFRASSKLTAEVSTPAITVSNVIKQFGRFAALRGVNAEFDSGKFYAILPMLPEVRDERECRQTLTKEYSSADSVMTLDETRELLVSHNLLLDYDPHVDPVKHQMNGAFSGELLR